MSLRAKGAITDLEMYMGSKSSGASTSSAEEICTCPMDSG